jgi:steroid 5-alpha reductase family enzyme
MNAMSVAIFLVLLVAVSVCLSLAMIVAWRIERKTGNAGWVDVCWTFGVGLVSAAAALAALFQQEGSGVRILLAVGLILLWSLRLGSHLVSRTKGIKDDPRYARMKQEWGLDAAMGMFKLLQSQALVSIPLVLSVALAAWSPVTAFRPQDALALAVGLVAIAGEALSDRQLRAFREMPGNEERFCDVGLWSWSRHPNYFFEWFGWLAYALFAIDFTGGYPFGSYPWGWLAFSGALCMYWLLNHVSGIPPLEDHMLKKYGERFRAYSQRTSAFFPLPPNSSHSRS